MDKRDILLRQGRKLVRSRANDAVELAFLPERALERLDELDLSAVSEIKRQSGGGVEIKFIDRLAVLRWLMEVEDDAPWGEELYQAMGRRQSGTGDG